MVVRVEIKGLACCAFGSLCAPPPWVCAAISWGASKVLPPLLFAGKGPCGMPPLWLPDRSTHGVFWAGILFGALVGFHWSAVWLRLREAEEAR